MWKELLYVNFAFLASRSMDPLGMTVSPRGLAPTIAVLR